MDGEGGHLLAMHSGGRTSPDHDRDCIALDHLLRSKWAIMAEMQLASMYTSHSALCKIVCIDNQWHRIGLAPLIDIQHRDGEPKEKIASIIHGTSDIRFIFANLDDFQLASTVIQRGKLVVALQPAIM
jgi:hypothetical protein